MVIGFFELRLSGLKRFPLWLSPYLMESSKGISFVFFYEQDDFDDKNELIKMLPDGSKLVKVAAINKKSIVTMLNEYQLNRLVVMAQRIPDSCFIAAAKLLGIPTIMYQHGLYIPFMKRESSLFLHNIHKSYRFFKYAITTASIVGASKPQTVLQYIKVYLFGYNAVDCGLPYRKINADKVMVYGEHWKDYHAEQFGYSKKNQVIVGAPDFNDLNDIIKNCKGSESLCYIAQTLVEDGRLPRAMMEQFIGNIAYAASTLGIKVFVRLHPRSDMSLYATLEGKAILSKTEFPKATVYLGHYSSIIAKATFFSDKIMLADFPEHNIPEYISMLNSFKFHYDDRKRFIKGLTDSLELGVDKEIVERNILKQDKYFDSSVREPLKTAALEILK